MLMQHSDEFKALCAKAQEKVKELTVAQTKQMLENSAIDYLIDVREQDEYSAGHIENAIHISKGWIEAKIHHHVPAKDKAIVLYCGSGNRSLLAAENLQKMGYANVYSMSGGYKGWLSENN